ncbi:efflux RND transporter periplasmic adaptor subunit [Dokdonella soli]
MQMTHKLKIGAAAALAVLVVCIGYVWLAPRGGASLPTKAAAPTAAQDTVTITELQAKHVSVIAAQMHAFDARLDAVGFIDFNQDHLAQVFSPYQGRVREVRAKAGDDVAKGQVLFTVDSPDLVQAESNLISTAGLLALTSKTLERARQMITIQANAVRDIEQAVSDQQTAAGNYQAARNALRIFGKSDADMDRIAASRKIDGELRVVSPFAGRVTARAAAPGVLVQPGAAPAPFTVADLSSVWMVANVVEGDVAALRIGQSVSVTVAALPGRKLQGSISYIGSTVDPSTHRVSVRSEIADPQHELRPQMLATFVVHTGAPVQSVGVPANAVVREGDGTMTVFVTGDGRRFVRRVVKLGLQQDGMDQIIEGLSASERAAGDGALFVSNALALQSN